jgi:imidazoleglycerol-phosphate dehydratase
MMRTATIKRNTEETQIELTLNLDDYSTIDVDTGIGFFNHMLTAFAKHGRFGLIVKAKGDLEVDPHHTTEDVGIALGLALKQALGNKAGIERFGSALIPLNLPMITLAATTLKSRKTSFRPLPLMQK